MSTRRILLRSFGEVVNTPNTFIGGVGATSVTSAADLASFTNLLEAEILDFSIDGSNNVSCYIETNYYLLGGISNLFRGDSDLTYFIDLDGNITTTFSESFRTTPNCESIFLPNINAISSSTFRVTGVRFIDFPNTLSVTGGFSFLSSTSIIWARFESHTSLNNAGFMRDCTGVERIYLGSCTSWNDYSGTSNEQFYRIKLNCVIYVPNSQLTSDGGNPAPPLDYAQSVRSATLVGITDYTAPSEVTDLSASSITSSGCNLDFTAPSSTNTLDFYEVWIENIDLDEWHKDRVEGRYNIDQEITATGDTITGLATGTNYKIWIVACDEYWNRSAISNMIEITTL